MATTTDRSLWLGRLFDTAAYAAATTAVVAVAAAVPSFALGFGWVGVKWALFLVGWLAFGYGTLALRPSPPWKGDDPVADGDGAGEVVGGRQETRFQALVQALPPARFHPLPVDDRLPAGVNVFVAGLAMLVTSFALEAVFGVGVA